MRFLHSMLALVVLALASGTALARDHGGGGHVGGFAGHAASGHMSGGPVGGPGFSGGNFARGHAGGQFVGHGFHHGFHAGPRFGVVLGSTIFADPFYYPPNYYAPAPAYYCASARAYYPDVTYCAEGWQQVVPRAAPY